MDYRVEIFAKEDWRGYGHVYLILTDKINKTETTAGFYPDLPTGEANFAPLIGIAKAKIVNDDSNYTNSRSFDISIKQYNDMLIEISNIKARTKNGQTTYDLLDHDENIDDFSCISFTEHILRVGNINNGNIKLGLFPQVSMDASYMNNYGKAYFDMLSFIAGTDGEAEIKFRNGAIRIENGGWDSHTTIPSSNITIDTSFNTSTKNFSIATNKEINNKGFILGALNLASILDTTQITINNITFDITKTNNLTVRNALEDIPEVSFLLSHILIYPDEKLDMGDKGIYTIKSGDTLSQIAEKFGFTTKKVLQLNTWLIDTTP